MRHRPSQMGISQEELREGLEFAAVYMSGGAKGYEVNSIMRHRPAVEVNFDTLWGFLEIS